MKALIVLNPRGGKLAKLGIDWARQQIAARCAANNLDATIAVVPGGGIADRIKSEIAAGPEGARSGFDRVVIGGGDGSVRAAASVLAGSSIPLGILPLGTLNHFARDLGLPIRTFSSSGAPDSPVWCGEAVARDGQRPIHAGASGRGSFRH